MAAGMTPSFTSLSVMCAVRTATTVSQAHARPTPNPMADPFMQQMVNWGRLAHSMMYRAMPVVLSSSPCFRIISPAWPLISVDVGFSKSGSSSGDVSCARCWPPATPASICACWNDFGSPPAQNIRPVPVSTTIRMSGRPLRIKAASCKPKPMPPLMALLAAGRLSVQYAMPSRTSSRNSSLFHCSTEKLCSGFDGPICSTMSCSQSSGALIVL
mmetsp:Transcript_9630/g.28429  ORF Transcript_9630/g.28429 Transcript_9630/m.28429 type:complete len:214 (-) Transcript_9630:258-899(-)